MKTKLLYHFEPLTERKFQVSVTQPDGLVRSVGTVEHIYVRHLKQHGWEATGPDGHLGVHQFFWQSLWVLTWDRRGYPFPVNPSHERNVIIDN